MTSESPTGLLQEKLSGLSNAQKRLLLERLRQAGITSPSRGGRLVAFYQSPEPLGSEELRAICTEKLPAHMVPQQYVHQEKIALTSTGKIDRNRMRARLWNKTPVAVDEDMTTARNSVEQTLSEIWCDVLGIDEISVFDNFFEVGGDSLQVIRILSRATKAGLAIKPDAIFAHPTIAELAQRVEDSEDEPKVEHVGYGPLPLLPIQNWFFNVVDSNQQHWNQSFLFALGKPVETQRLVRIIEKLLAHHDGLRTTFRKREGVWRSRIVENTDAAVRVFALESSSHDDNLCAMRAVADEENASFDLGCGPLFRVIHYPQSGGSGYLGLIAHHLIVDAVSWQVIVSDIQLLLASGSLDSALPSKPDSIKRWSEKLEQFASSSNIDNSTRYWTDKARETHVALPTSSTGEIDNSEGQCQWLSRALGREYTDTLRSKSPKKLRASVQEIVLSSLIRVISNWTGNYSVTIDLEGHGRESLFDHFDVSQTVGWCTSVFPVTFSAESESGWTSSRDALRYVKEQLRAVPLNGLSHGLVRYMSQDVEVRKALDAAPRAQLLFNYLGREDTAPVPNAPLTVVDHRFGTTRHPDTQRAYRLELNAVIRHDDLVIDWAFCPKLHAPELVARLADDLLEAIKELVTAEDEGASSVVTPTDFPMAGLDQAALDSLSSQLDGLDDELDDD